jgi:hypothetical protein
MAASSEWCTFADDDVWWDDDHLSNIRTIAKGYKWGSTLRKIWSSAGEFLGIDKFESVGDDPTRTVPYEMCDNNTIFFRRELGVAAAHLYRETKQYNDDRLMYQFLKHVGGERGRTGVATVNHICPDRLIPFFRTNCVKPEKPLNRNSLCPCGSGKKYKHFMADLSDNTLPRAGPLRQTAAGGLMSYATDQDEVFRLAASYVDRMG